MVFVGSGHRTYGGYGFGVVFRIPEDSCWCMVRLRVSLGMTDMDVTADEGGFFFENAVKYRKFSHVATMLPRASSQRASARRTSDLALWKKRLVSPVRALFSGR